MSATKTNRTRKSGRGRGVPIRIARMIAKRYSLSQIVVFTSDDQRRQRLLTWGRSNSVALEASTFGNQVAKAAGWPKPSSDFEIAFVRRLKGRIKELETALAQIVDGCPDPVALARAAGKFPDESEDEESLGSWVFFREGKLSRGQKTGGQRWDDSSPLSPDQLSAQTVKMLAYYTWRKLVDVNFANVAGEIETAMVYAMRRFKGWKWKGKDKR